MILRAVIVVLILTAVWLIALTLIPSCGPRVFGGGLCETLGGVV